MKKVNVEEIQSKSREELIDDLNHCRYSILDSIGCKKLRLEMKLPGLASAIIVRYLVWKAKRNHGENWTTNVRSYLIKLFKKRAPYTIKKGENVPVNSGGIVIGFNHPSLGEILRIIALVSKNYPYDNYLFPVNLPWYEALCPVVDKMEEAGFKLTPIVTPSTRRKIEKVAGEKMLKLADELNAKFNTAYMNLCRKFLKNGDVVVVAPSATRQATIFKTDEQLCQKEKIEPSTMSLLTMALTREKDLSSGLKFVPIAVKPQGGFKRGLNLGMMYEFGVAESFTLDEAIDLTKERYGECRGRKFDFEFLARISIRMFHLGNYKMIAPFVEDWAMDGLAKIMEPSKMAAL